MSFSQENGYVPVGFDTIMISIMNNINTQFDQAYTFDVFQGTNFYKYFYALVQRVQENEVKTAEVFAKLQKYIEVTNEMISRPIVTNPGLVDFFTNHGFIVSLKPMIDADAGKIHLCVDLDDGAPDYAEKKLEVCGYLKQATAAGTVTQGTEVESLTLTNGQSFDFKFFLPDRITIHLRLTIETSENNQVAVDSVNDIKAKLLANIAAKYKLGKNFEPQKYFSIIDAPWAGQVTLEWSNDAGATWNDDIYDADFDELFEVSLANTTVVEV